MSSSKLYLNFDNEQTILTSSVTKGAISPPTLACIEPVPIPVFRSTVGNSSAEKTYTMPNDPEMQKRPIIERIVRAMSISEQKRQTVCVCVVTLMPTSVTQSAKPDS